jgi:hypothetical protein
MNWVAKYINGIGFLKKIFSVRQLILISFKKILKEKFDFLGFRLTTKN